MITNEIVSTLVNISSAKNRLQSLYKIKDKNKNTVGFRHNKIQQQIEAKISEIKRKNKPVRLLILKPRQIGCTTYFGIRNLDKSIFKKNQFAAIIAHRNEKAKEIFNEIVKFSYDNIDPEIKQYFPAYNDSVNQLAFKSIASQIKVTSDGHGITPNLLHITEVARMRNAYERISETLQGVPRFGEVVLESTAAGKQGYFYDLCEETISGNSLWDMIFIKWWENPEYCLPVPVNFIMTNEEIDLLSRFAHDGFSIGNIVFRREKISEVANNKSVENIGISGDMVFRQNYPMTANEAFIANSMSIFDIESLERMRQTAPKPLVIQQFAEGYFHGFKEKIEHEPYKIACDPSYGESNDYSAIIVFDKQGDIVGSLKGKYIPHKLTEILVKLGKYYNNALLIVERNTGHAVLNELINYADYSNIYYHRDYDAKTRQHTLKPGFPTNIKTRAIIISELETTIKNNLIMIPDERIIEECLSFGYLNGKIQAVSGNDDLVLALAIGNYICNQPNIALPPEQGFKKPKGL